MTIIDAVKLLMEKPDAWVRPVAWRGQAVMLRPETRHERAALLVVPAPGGDIHLNLELNDFVAEWIVVSPDIVHSERR